MRLHTSLTMEDIHAALKRAKDAGHITSDVMFDPLAAYASRSHRVAFEVQLGAANGGGLPADYTNQYGKRQKTRRTRNARDMNLRFSATWHEWGWFMAEVYRRDPNALWGSGPGSAIYKNRADFDQKTKWQFTEETPARDFATPIFAEGKPRTSYTPDSIVFGG